MALNAAQAVCSVQIAQQVLTTLSSATEDEQADIQATVANVSRFNEDKLQNSLELQNKKCTG